MATTSYIFLCRSFGKPRKHSLLTFRLCHKDYRTRNYLIDENLKTCEKTSCSQNYMETEKIPLPLNIKVQSKWGTTCFSSSGIRDISGAIIAVSASSNSVKENYHTYNDDIRIDKYDCSGAVNLCSSMQTNVPDPFRTKHKPTHLNMPDGQVRQQAKYTSDELHNCHYINNRNILPVSTRYNTDNSSAFKNLLWFFPKRNFSTKKNDAANMGEMKQKPTQTKRQQLQSAIKEYGSVVLVLHITLSLCSLGIFYSIAKSGVDLDQILSDWGYSEGASAAGAVGPFVIAYAVHKVLAPLRITLSLALTPLVVRFLRNKGYVYKKK